METNTKRGNESRKAGLHGYAEKLYLKGKTRWAGWMGEKAATLSQRQLYFLLSVFIAAMGACCCWQLYNGITGNHAVNINSGRLKTIVTEEKAGKDTPVLSTGEYIKIQRFHHYMDSLASTAAGKKVRDSILEARPGLPDSIASLEAYYRSNLNK
ncbi:hypothetical protein [Flavobacterium coralii]|uniref:hypothetical protein n=1 Tax=Flavobacterium coralii TaxID=2838017 RepID=UPI000C37B5C5|nr:hypothetical protein [Flavobacterium sp.]|tara:strand:+ start:9460 stop:9924 length:465 start_codon:yes stop_codon:yes gene_type:complete